MSLRHRGESPLSTIWNRKCGKKPEELEFLNALYDDPKERRELEAEQLLQDPNMKSTLMVVVVVALVSIALLLVFLAWPLTAAPFSAAPFRGPRSHFLP